MSTEPGAAHYVDTRGQVSTCCQLSQYGFNENDVVADLNRETLAQAHEKYVARLAALGRAARPAGDAVSTFPCLRCAKASGKLNWLKAYPQSAWHAAALDESDTLYQLSTGRPGQSAPSANPPLEVAV